MSNGFRNENDVVYLKVMHGKRAHLLAKYRRDVTNYCLFIFSNRKIVILEGRLSVHTAGESPAQQCEVARKEGRTEPQGPNIPRPSRS